MGNQQRSAISKDEERPSNVFINKHDRYEPSQIYWDQDGNLRYGQSNRNREQEIIDILQKDSGDDDDPLKLWVIVPSRWVRLWLSFAVLKEGNPPGKINTSSLLVKDRKVEGGIRPKRSLKPPTANSPGHYRRISLKTWQGLVSLYGADGGIIVVKGVPYDDLSRWRVFFDAERIDESKLPPPKVPVEEPEKGEKNSQLLAGKLQTVGYLKLSGSS